MDALLAWILADQNPDEDEFEFLLQQMLEEEIGLEEEEIIIYRIMSSSSSRQRESSCAASSSGPALLLCCLRASAAAAAVRVRYRFRESKGRTLSSTTAAISIVFCINGMFLCIISPIRPIPARIFLEFPDFR